MTLRAYHESELRIARDPSHPAHILPAAPSGDQLILDIGCGAGQTLLATLPGRFAVGVDIDSEALTLAREWNSDAVFACGRAEALPFAAESFDAVWARVSLAYTDVAKSLQEARRVLKRGGGVWMVLHPAAIPWRAARSGGWKAWLFFGYIAANSIWFHLTGQMFALAGRYESFQTEAGMKRALARAGFRQIHIQRGRHFVMTATAP